MIDFACKKFDIEEVIRCSLGLTKTEFKILMFFLKHKNGSLTASFVSKKFKMGLSTAQKAIKRLREEKLIKRGQKNLAKGGYVFVYSVRDREEIKMKILDVLRRWMKKVEAGLKEW